MNTHRHSQSLNDFSDVILRHILSFLPTKYAARTSVLSKRWKYMWTSLPSLDFRDYERPTRELFMNFVERALVLQNPPLIQKFSLYCDVENEVSRIRTWISGAVRRKAREIHISFLDDPYLLDDDVVNVLPFCLLNCETLEVLKLKIHFSVRLPFQICLPCLQILTLKNITFTDYHPTNLLFASPALEQLVLDDCTWEGYKSKIIISASKLRKLTINEGVKDWEGRLGLNSVTISSPKVKVFRYTGGFIKKYRFPYISDVTLKFHSTMKTNDIHSCHFEEFLRSLKLAKCLHLSFLFIEPMFHVTMPIFKNLMYLEILDYRIDDPSYEELETLLNNCPCLDTLKFPRGVCLDPDTSNFDNLQSLNLIYLPSTLKRFMIGGFLGSIKEMSIVQFILAKMTSLKSMEIVFRSDIVQRREIETLLSALPRGSKSCQVNFS